MNTTDAIAPDAENPGVENNPENAGVYTAIAKNGLWTNNPALVQLLGLCPLLAVSGSVVNALGLGLATMLVLVGSNTSVSLIRNHVSDAVRLPVFVMIIASFTTCTEMLMKAFTYELFEILGIFIPLIVTNCVILGRADAFASKNKLAPAIYDGFMMGLGFALVLITIGAVRELLGQGTLFSNMDLLFGPMATHWKITLLNNYSGFLVAILPPGAFLVVGFLVAIKNIIDSKIKDSRDKNRIKTAKGSKRVRTTGTIS
ncbi:electron transport complex subunit E [Simiduia curdlanivorans]|uniref:Ion-translocating oxidoreductase complex subunit E n=1 Tax=Simiduia curdlanivorans TaxID=1492769 RepID=A0ABV8V6L4_9GAMM|nr:electron transport complex subunit E [Simiduia curdlanivorans]MDN3638851.1 electron transport complex subunit E [Simiduia curdlanivorans]